MSSIADTITLIADIPNKKIGCVLIQAMAGCNSSILHDIGFDTKAWALAPAKTQRRMSGTRGEWERFAKICNEAHQ